MSTEASTNTAKSDAIDNTALDLAMSLVGDQMQDVDSTIKANLNSEVALINQLGAYIVQAGGKRLRPVALLLADLACTETGQTSAHATTLAAIVEFIHTATLLHDDVVDESELRRGRETANELFGNAASVLVGDYLYSRSFQMMVSVNKMQVMDVLSRTTNQIAEGEVMQLLNCGSADTSEAQYMNTIQSKTAILFAAATELGAIVAGSDSNTQAGLYQYGLHLGTAFQLVDDVLDYTADAELMGKNVGDDLAEGKPTLPIIHAIRESQGKDRDLLCEAITNSSRDKLSAVLEIIGRTKSLQYTSELAIEQAELAKQNLSSLGDTSAKTALMQVADFAVTRVY